MRPSNCYGTVRTLNRSNPKNREEDAAVHPALHFVFQSFYFHLDSHNHQINRNETFLFFLTAQKLLLVNNPHSHFFSLFKFLPSHSVENCTSYCWFFLILCWRFGTPGGIRKRSDSGGSLNSQQGAMHNDNLTVWRAETVCRALCLRHTSCALGRAEPSRTNEREKVFSTFCCFVLFVSCLSFGKGIC